MGQKNDRNFFFLALLTLQVLVICVNSEKCLQKCICTKNRKSGPFKLRVNCTMIISATKQPEILLPDVIDLTALSPNSFHLILRQNKISTIKKRDFELAGMLLKLDLSHNNINYIQERSFKKLNQLKKLDLSNNRISRLSKSMFYGLSKLERLDIGSNLIFNLIEDTFDSLRSLKTIVLEYNPIICDCHLAWFPNWLRENKIRPSSRSACSYPIKVRKSPLHNITESLMNCNGPLEVPTFKIIPSEEQLVFGEDSMALTCEVSNVPNISVYWTLNNVEGKFWNFGNQSDLQNGVHFNQLRVKEFQKTDDGLVGISITTESVDGAYYGDWKCHAKSPQGEISKSVRVTVISNKTVFCPAVVTSGRKGMYSWPKTISSNTIHKTCQVSKGNTLGSAISKVYFSCNKEGRWQDLNTSACAYVSRITKVLHQISNLVIPPFTDGAVILQQITSLYNYTYQNYKQFTDIDVNFIAEIIVQYHSSSAFYVKFHDAILEIINVMMRINPLVLSSSNLNFGSGIKFLDAINILPKYIPNSLGLSFLGDNLAVKRFLVRSTEPDEMICTSMYYIIDSAVVKRSINCDFYNFSMPLHSIKDDLAGVQGAFKLPVGFLDKYEDNLTTGQLFQLSVFSDGHLYHLPEDELEVTSAVLSANFSNLSFEMEISYPVVVMLKSTNSATDVPVWWNSSSKGGLGGWQKDGCSVERRLDDHLIFSCLYLGSYALVKNIPNTFELLEVDLQEVLLLDPTIYIGSLICCTFLIVSIFLYISFYSEIKMSSSAKHSLINTWICTFMLCVVFNFGIRMTTYLWLCKAIGVLINYLTLAVFPWIVVTLGNINSKLSKRIHEPDSEAEDETSEMKVKKPIIRFYFFGWGVPIIICGIATAVHINIYGSKKLCSLPINPSIPALYFPSAVFIAVIFYLYLRIGCLVSTNHQPQMLLNETINSVPNGSDNECKSDGEEITTLEISQPLSGVSHHEDDNIDEEHSYTTQSRGQLCYLVLYVLICFAASMYISNPKQISLGPHQSLIISGLYCLLVSVLGLYVFLFHCYLRADVRRCMHRMLFPKVVTPISSLPQSDITILTNITNTSGSEKENVRVETSSPSPLEKANFSTSVASSINGDITANELVHPDIPVNVYVVKQPMVTPRIGYSNSDAGLLNKDSSNSILSIATTDRSQYTLRTMQSFGVMQSQLSMGLGTRKSGGMSEVGYNDPRQNDAAKKFFQRQRKKRQKLNLKNVGRSESSAAEDTNLDTTIDASLHVPKISTDTQVPNYTITEVCENTDNNRSPIKCNGDGQNGVLELPDDSASNLMMCRSPSSVASFSRRSCQSENIGSKYAKKRHGRHRDPKAVKGSSVSVTTNGTNSYPARTHRKKRKKSKLSRSISAYEQINNNHYVSTSSEAESVQFDRKPRSKSRNKNSPKKETTV